MSARETDDAERRWAVRVPRTDRDAVWQSLSNGFLPLTWPNLGQTDLGEISRKREAGARLTKQERAAWAHRRVLAEGGGIKAGDLMLLPNMPFDATWSLVRATGPYTFDPSNPVSPHVVSAELLSDVRLLDPEQDEADEGLRRSLKSPGRFWPLDRFADELHRLESLIERDRDLVEVRRQRLARFWENNPDAQYTVENGIHFVTRPWGDDTLRLYLWHDAPALEDDEIATLNAVVLPTRLTALWHVDSRDLEVIFAPIPRGSHLRNRGFDFHFAGKKFRCEFGDASDRLLSIAGASLPVLPPTSTVHRNTGPFRDYLSRMAHPKGDGTPTLDLEPTSFWIRSIAWKEDEVLQLVRHLNFYMRFFDLNTPQILIHDEHATPEAAEDLAAYPSGEFPTAIVGRPLDQYLLGLLQTAMDGDDRFTSFLYAYQVLEYAAFYHMQDSISRDVRRILTAPDTVSRPGEASREILDLLAEDRSSPEDKMTALFRNVVDGKAIWQQIERRKPYFASDIEFDGGFTLPALIRAEWETEDFLQAWLPKWPDQLRKLRNALVHAREARQARALAPTVSNYERIEPWLSPMYVCAMQVIVNRDLS